MKKVAIFFANGFEEIEALVPQDLFERTSAIEVYKIIVDDVDDKPIIIGKNIYKVDSSHSTALSLELSQKNIILSDKKTIDIIKTMDAVVFPGGLRGANNLSSSAGVCEVVKSLSSTSALLCAICASPAAVLAKYGVINNENPGVCYPGCEKMSLNDSATSFLGEKFADEHGVCVSGNVISARSAGASFYFAFDIIKKLCGEDVKNKVEKAIIF